MRFTGAFVARIAVVTLMLSGAVFAEEAEKSITVEGTKPKGSFDAQRPDYLHFKEVKVTREGKQRLRFEITLRGEIPLNPKETVRFYLGFDIDQNASTGSASVGVADFGQDIGAFIY